MRADHPAAHSWSAEAFDAWPHLSVQTGDKLHVPVMQGARQEGIRRRIALVVPQFSAVGDILSKTDLIATMPRLMLEEVAQHHQVILRPVPIALPPLEVMLYRSKKLMGDEVVTWAANTIQGAVLQLFAASLKRYGPTWSTRTAQGR